MQDDLYFFVQGDYVKIGRGKSDDRLKSLQTGNPNKIEAMLVIPGGGWAEKAYHDLFSQYRTESGGREWFELSNEIRAEIERLTSEVGRSQASANLKKAIAPAQPKKKDELVFDGELFSDYLNGILDTEALIRFFGQGVMAMNRPGHCRPTAFWPRTNDLYPGRADRLDKLTPKQLLDEWRFCRKVVLAREDYRKELLGEIVREIELQRTEKKIGRKLLVSEIEPGNYFANWFKPWPDPLGLRVNRHYEGRR